MLRNESKYYLLKNVQPRIGAFELDYNVVECANFETISSMYFAKERYADNIHRDTFRSCTRDQNDGLDWWMFTCEKNNGDKITFVLCGEHKVRDFVTHIEI